MFLRSRLLLVIVVAAAAAAADGAYDAQFGRSSFPPGFLFGTASSAYQRSTKEPPQRAAEGQAFGIPSPTNTQ
ncbi:hypothetical protein Taro_025119, partial [Colocasia esculenta]|nr:hypothetical protein [Colocasia esculenta]